MENIGISINAATDMQLETQAGDISLKSPKDISLDASQTLHLSAKSIKLEGLRSLSSSAISGGVCVCGETTLQPGIWLPLKKILLN